MTFASRLLTRSSRRPRTSSPTSRPNLRSFFSRLGVAFGPATQKFETSTNCCVNSIWRRCASSELTPHNTSAARTVRRRTASVNKSDIHQTTILHVYALVALMSGEIDCSLVDHPGQDGRIQL